MNSFKNRYLDWCKTIPGRKFGTSACIGLNVGVFCSIYLPHTYFLDKLQDIQQLYRMKKPVPLPEEMKLLVDEVMDDLKVHDVDRKLIKPFMSSLPTPYHAGIMEMKTGGIIGIPINFLFKSPYDVDITRILIHNLPIDTARNETENVAQSMILSRDAQKFVIAREILSLQNSNVIMDGITGSGLFVVAYCFCQWLKEKFNMYNKSLSLRILLYTFSGLAGLGVYFVQKDFFTKRTEKKVDKKISELNPNYVKGGYEYYKKLLERNRAHRALMDEYGKRLFYPDGNDGYFIRQKTTPITQRKSFFEMLLTTEEA